MARDISLGLIDPDPNQPRKTFSPDALDELARSLKADGLLQAILLRPVGDRYVVVHGERRWRAAQRLGWNVIRAEVRDIAADEAPWLALAENLQRVDLNPIEEAQAYQSLLSTGVTQTLLGQRIGKSQSHIATKLRFLALVPDAQSAMVAGALSEGQAKQLLRVHAPEQQATLCQQALAEHWTVIRLKQEVDVLLTPRSQGPQTPAELMISWWEKRGRIPGHDPYPEEAHDGRFDHPIAVQSIPLVLIRLPSVLGTADYRGERDPSYAAWLAEIFITLPPIAVFQDAATYVVADGRYRLMAAEQLHRETIDCRIYVPRGTIHGGHFPAGVDEEAYTYGLSQNSAGGIPYSKTDLQHILRRYQELHVT